MAINKVQYGNQTLIDLTADTVTAASLLSGFTAHDKSGSIVNGTYEPTIYATYDGAGTVTLHVNGEGDPVTLQSKSATPSLTAQTITADEGYTGLSKVEIAAMTAGSAGTPIATKGSVSNNSISITPSVTNVTGYITGGSITGTTVSVAASELVSGKKSISANGTDIDVTNYEKVDVAVPVGNTKNIQMCMGRYEVSATAYTATNLSIKVNKAGTYKCYWSMDRNTTSGTSGSRLYNGNTELGSAHTSWAYNNNNRYGMNCEETLTFAKDDIITVRARSRNTSYICGVMNFVIEEQ